MPQEICYNTPDMNGKLKFTLKAWPMIAVATIGLCFVTQGVAKLFGIDLPDQQNVEVVRAWLCRAFESPKAFANCALLLAQVLVILPAVEEVVFRLLLWKLPAGAAKKAAKRFPALEASWPSLVLAAVSSALFSAAHYIAQPFPDAAFLALFFFGFAQCCLYHKTERIWCPMLNHFLFNLTNIVLLLILPQ